MFPPTLSSSTCFLFVLASDGLRRGVCTKKDAGMAAKGPPKVTIDALGEADLFWTWSRGRDGGVLLWSTWTTRSARGNTFGGDAVVLLAVTVEQILTGFFSNSRLRWNGRETGSGWQSRRY